MVIYYPTDHIILYINCDLEEIDVVDGVVFVVLL